MVAHFGLMGPHGFLDNLLVLLLLGALPLLARLFAFAGVENMLLGHRHALVALQPAIANNISNAPVETDPNHKPQCPASWTDVPTAPAAARASRPRAARPSRLPGST